MNARFYVPSIGRFASADTIVPDPINPQSYNKYSYALNDPLKFTDPTGHCAQADDECWALADQLYQQYGWYIDGVWAIDEVRMFLNAGQVIVEWLAHNGGGDAIGRMRDVFGGTRFAHADFIGSNILNAHHVRGSTVYLLAGFALENVVHELAHVLDNRLGFGWPIGSALFGDGPADDMARLLGANPATCGWNRSRCSRYETPSEDIFPSGYASNGPSEDFADSFMLTVFDGAGFQSSHPVRATFLTGLAESLTTVKSEYIISPSPYFSRRLIPVPAPTPITPTP